MIVALPKMPSAQQQECERELEAISAEIDAVLEPEKPPSGGSPPTRKLRVKLREWVSWRKHHSSLV